MTRNSEAVESVEASLFRAAVFGAMYVGGVFLLGPLVLYDAFFMHLIWAEYIQQLVPGTPTLPILAFAVARVFLTVLRPRPDSELDRPKPHDEIGKKVFGLLLRAPTAWLVCWVLTWWMS